MKTIHTALLIGVLAFTTACSETTTETKAGETPAELSETIIGRWKLTKEERMKTREKGVEYSNQPTNVVLHIQKNGYFIIYDTFIDPKWKLKGLPLIQQRSKGQWQVDEKQLVLTHLSDDTTYTEELEVTSLDDNQLVTKGKDKKSNVYKTYGK